MNFSSSKQQLETRTCLDCGGSFQAYVKAKNKVRCLSCQEIRNREIQRKSEQNRRRQPKQKTHGYNLSPERRAEMVSFVPRPDDPQHEDDCRAFVGRYFSFADLRDQVKAGYMPSGLVVEIQGERRVVAGTELVAA